MDVRIVTFPETHVACFTHFGRPESEHDTVRKLLAWKLENRLLNSARHRHYGLHYTDSRARKRDQHRVDFCLSVDKDDVENSNDIEWKIIPRMKCAYARDVGSRLNNRAAAYLYAEWLPGSGEELSDYPIIFHYVNVGPNVSDDEAITDVYMPLK